MYIVSHDDLIVTWWNREIGISDVWFLKMDQIRPKFVHPESTIAMCYVLLKLHRFYLYLVTYIDALWLYACIYVGINYYYNYLIHLIYFALYASLLLSSR